MGSQSNPWFRAPGFRPTERMELPRAPHARAQTNRSELIGARLLEDGRFSRPVRLAAQRQLDRHGARQKCNQDRLLDQFCSKN
jgi:hypothetical protein